MVDTYELTSEQKIAKNWLAKNFMPYIMVHASPGAIAKLAPNNLRPAEFLRPFGAVGNLGGYAFRTVGDQNESIKLSNFRVNFVGADALCLDQK